MTKVSPHCSSTGKQPSRPDLALLERRPVADVAGRFRCVFRQAELLVGVVAQRTDDLLLTGAGTLRSGVNINCRMVQVHKAPREALARRIKDMAVGLLNDGCHFQIRFGFEFAYLALLVLRQFLNATGLD